MLYTQDQLDTLNAQLEELQAELNSKQHSLDNFAYEADESEFDIYLNDLYGTVEVAGYTMDTSTVLKECDPTAYRCEMANYEANYNLDSSDEYNELKEEVEDLENQISDLESEIQDLEDNLENGE